MSHLENLRQTMKTLRGPAGCSWDKEQTHESLIPHLIEECYELIDAIDRKDFPHMQEELGDLLLQVYFHGQIAEENGQFTIEDIAQSINEKLIRRHPHIFGDSKNLSPEEVIAQWEKIKKEEKATKKDQPVFDKSLPPFPALLYAASVVNKGAKKGNLLNLGSVVASTEEEKLGKELFELVSKCDAKNINPEQALRKFTNKIKPLIH
jgi:XTP/dITP diphosphohydrolase/tetrapyrrole methylase family protein/MazG family protein